MVLICPKCKTKLRIDKEKIPERGVKFRCPRCKALLFVKRPPVKKPPIVTKKGLDAKKILVAHSDRNTINEITSILTNNGYQTVASYDGIDAMVKAVREMPFLSIIEVGLPKIYGFEVCKRLKNRSETKDMKFILISSLYDEKRYTREPKSLYGADDYVDVHRISEELIEKIKRVSGLGHLEEKEKQTEIKVGTKEVKAEESAIVEAPLDEKIERAKRLARTIISDIYLYNAAKVEESIKNNTFYSVFENELQEGLKLYVNRIPEEIRAKGDYYREAIEDFIERKKKVL